MSEPLNTSNILLVSGSIWIPLMFGLMFLFFPVSHSKINLGKYRNIKYLMSTIYLLFACVSIVAFLHNPYAEYHFSIRLYIPVVAIFHLPLFTLVNSSLISTTGSIKISGRMIGRILVSIILSIFYLVAYHVASWAVAFQILYYVVYALLLSKIIFCTYFFYTYYKAYKLFLDNYYSEIYKNHLDWVCHSQVLIFFTALAVFFLSMLPDSMMLPLLVIILVFYVYYALRIILYTARFLDSGRQPEHFPLDRIVVEAEEYSVVRPSDENIDVLLNKWVEMKSFVQPNITIVSVAAEIGTNRTYISNHINTNKQRTFKEWIAELRINEAKKMLIADPTISIGDVSVNVGFTDKSNFTRCFSRLNGCTPSEWRKTNLKNGKQTEIKLPKRGV